MRRPDHVTDARAEQSKSAQNAVADGHPAPSGGSPASEGREVFHFDDYRIESIQVGIIEVVDTDDDYDDD